MIGRTIAGRYRVVDRLGTGGMAEVWRAEDEVLGRSVAVKILHPQYAGEENFVARFRQEAQAAANLSHPNIVNVYDWGREDSTYFIVMEYLPGRTLKQILDEKGNLRPDHAVDIARQVASALAYAHKGGIVHRDVKPHNIIIGPEGQVKVTDFGIARSAGTQLTQTGSVMGTAQYISPEQAQGKETGPGSDIYSLGVMLYEMLTGNVPFDGESPVAVALKHVNEQPVSPRSLNPNISPDLERVVLKAMAKQPELRYRSADELADDLGRIAQGAAPRRADEEITQVMPAVTAGASAPGSPEGTTAQMPAAPRTGGTPRRERKRGSWAWIVIVLLLVLAAAGGAWALVAGSLPKTVEVPNVVGMQVKQAGTLLAQKKLRLAEPIEQRNDDTAPAGQVLSQDPPAGTKLKEGETVKLVVSLGKASVPLGNLIGLPLTEALRQIVNSGLVAGKITKRSDDIYPENTVLEQTPKPGSIPKGTEVDLVVSSGKARVTVPDIEGMTLAKAKAKLKDYGLGVEVVHGFSDEPTGTVFDQDPNAGSDVTSGAVVTVYVSKGPEMVEIPKVTGVGEDTATAKLEALNFIVIKEPTTVGDPAQVGIVQASDPAEFTKARKGSQVTLFVGKLP